jgi:ribosomal protein S18 acetylase RimI-like enzyme
MLRAAPDNQAMDLPYQLVRPESDALALRGLRVLVGGPEAAPGSCAGMPDHEVTEKVTGFIAYAQSIGLDSRRQVLAMRQMPAGPPLIAAICLWVPSPGRTAMIFTPGMSDYPDAAEAARAAIEAALQDARQAGVLLVQAMLEPADAAGKTVFAAAGLTKLATLSYMERRPPLHPPAFELPADLTMAAYEARTHGSFAEAISRSYADTLDCPALSGIRDIEDVVEGHKAVGHFDPQLWSVILRGQEPIGCLLLAEIRARQGLELVYLGLAPAGRGRGLGRVLMQRVLAIAARRHFAVTTLAVDAANVPALRLYRRCGYTSVAQRVAMIRRLG